MDNGRPDTTQSQRTTTENYKKRNFSTVALCVIMSAVTACISSVITVRLSLKHGNTQNSYPESTSCLTEETATFDTTEVQTQQQSAIETDYAETTVIYVTVPVTLPETTQAPTTTEPVTEPTTEEPTTPSKSAIYASAVHSVVGVSSYYTKTTRTLFGVKTSKEYSNGSGFFVSSDGYVVTNAHVIENAETITVTDYDGNTYDATFITQMEDNDIAILKIDNVSISVTFGTSSDISVGDDCLIIGNPMGNLSYTYTDGIISYVNRQITTTSGYYINVFQTNCAINSGNSGGPVFNESGEVIGVATAKYSTSEGLSFFIPIDDVIDFIIKNTNQGV